MSINTFYWYILSSKKNPPSIPHNQPVIRIKGEQFYYCSIFDAVLIFNDVY